jgi:protein-tyrosine phosphatase
MVCLGNICRSPLAEGIMKKQLPPDQFSVDSAGTAGLHIGKNPDPRSIAVAAQNGIDISTQVARKISLQDLDRYDHIFAMDKKNLYHLQQLAEYPAQIDKIKLLIENGEVPDPYYEGRESFEHVYNLIQHACDHIAKQLIPSTL